VLSNLIGNAIKFTPEGGTITLHGQARDGTLSVTIADTGPGIAPEDLAHIFDRYWRPKGAEQDGTGLGLYIVRRIVEAHGGRVRAESSPQGATFVFTLPLETRRD
jgi:signal transduction histidine kinase